MLRAVGWALGGALALIGFYAGFFTLYQPRDPDGDRAPPRTLSRSPTLPGQASLLFAGDTMLGYDALPTLEERGFLYAFGSTLDLVRAADLAVVNAEAPITDGGTRFPVWKEWSYRAPAASVAALAEAGFDVVALANNHATDYGPDGLADTIANLVRAGLVPYGAGRDSAEARRGVIADVGGIRIGLLAYCERQLLWNVWVDQYARPHHPGVAGAAEPDLGRDIARLRAAGAELIVVSLHIGDNYEPPTASALAWSRHAVDAGADLVVNHHPHVAHPILRWKGKPVLLSIGNYAFGTRARAELDYGLLALARARRCPGGGAAFERVEIVPLAVQNERVRYRPERLVGSELQTELTHLAQISRPYGAELTLADDRAVLALDGCAGGSGAAP